MLNISLLVLDVINKCVEQVDMRSYHEQIGHILTETDAFTKLKHGDEFIPEGQILFGIVTRYVKTKYGTVTTESIMEEFGEINETIQTFYEVLSLTPLYAFESHIFTSCGGKGATGPTWEECLGAYDGVGWIDPHSSDTGALSMKPRRVGIQIWTVPIDAEYEIEAFGAGHQNGQGKGAIARGIFKLKKGKID